MKKIIGIILLFVIFLNSCINKNNGYIKEFEFVLQGNVKNGEGRSLKLSIPSKYPYDTLISEIKNGKYFFKGKLGANEKASLSIANNLSGRMPTKLFLIEDTIILDLQIGKQFDEITFISDTILKSDINLYARNFYKKYWKINRVWVFNDSIRNDSMRKNVYPSVRHKTLELIENQLNKKEYSPIKLDYLRSIFEDNSVYNIGDLSVFEKKQLKKLYKEIDTSLKYTPDYKIVESYISSLENRSQKLTFKDFTLIDINGKEIKLSNVISDNEFTVIDFWWSGCGPCRKFNQENKFYYNELKDKGIEVVSINVDDDIEKWEKSTLKDSINWINLYAGQNSTVLIDYNVRSFPTIVVFNKKKQIIDIDFKKLTNL